MYFLELFYKNAKFNGTGKVKVRIRNGKIPKWTTFISGRQSEESMRLLTLGLTGVKYSSKLRFEKQQLLKVSGPFLHMETLIACHKGIDNQDDRYKFADSAIRVYPEGDIRKAPGDEIHHLSMAAAYSKMVESAKLNRHFLLAYGPRFDFHRGTDDFDFNDPFMRVNRIRTMFDSNARLTDPTAFLSILAHRAKYKRVGPLHTMERLCALGHTWLQLNTSAWMIKHHDFEKQLSLLPAWKVRMLLPLLDICRHLVDAFPKTHCPLDFPGVLLLHRPDLFCTEGRFVDWLHIVDALVPNFQVFITLPERLKQRVPSRLIAKRLELPEWENKVERKASLRMPSRFVLLVQVDGHLPNLALMKLSRRFKKRRKKVVLTRRGDFFKGPEAAFASCIFNFESSLNRVARLRKNLGGILEVGGSGVDISMKLEKQIEELDPDYDLYPELGDRAIGFITRGCPNKCSFCIVPQKEGKVHQVSELDSLFQKRKKLILLDDNILSHPKADTFLEQMYSRKVRVNFTQTLDLRLIDKYRAGLLRRIQCENTRFTRKNYYFSLNNDKNLSLIAKKYRLMNFTSQDNVEFICMYGYNTTLAQDVRRFAFLRSLPGAYVFVQQYRPIKGGPPANMADFFDDKADERIDELIGICFAQNMRNVENYYRWVSGLYVETFGKLHMNLVDTIFRYNNRHRKGVYIASLSETGKRT